MFSENRAAGLQWVLVVLGVIFYLFVFPHGIHGDGYARYVALMGILEEGKLLPILYSNVGPLISSPLYYMGKIVKDSHWWLSRFNTFVFLGTAWFFWKSLGKEWSREQGRLFLLLFFCATMFPKHVTDYYSEVFSACFAGIAFLLLIRNRFWWGGFLLCLSVWNTPGTLLGACLAAAYFFFIQRRLRFLFLPFFLAGGVFLENFLKFGEFFPKAYLVAAGVKNLLPYSGGPGFTYPLFFGVLSVLLSYGKGIGFFSPGIFLAFKRGIFSQGSVGGFLAVGFIYLCGLVLVFSRWWAWSGDWFWGPRFYLFTSVWAAVALTTVLPQLHKNLRLQFFWFFAALLSFWVGAQGILFGQDFLEDCYRNGNSVEFICHYVPEYSVLWRPFIVWPELRGRKIAYAVFFFLVALAVLWRPGLSLFHECYSKAKVFWRDLRQGAWGW